jgi:hypothetical protein
MVWILFTFIPISIFMLTGLIEGAISTWRQIKRMRLPKTGEVGLIVWQEFVGFGILDEPLIESALLLHDILQIIFAVLCFLIAIRGWGNPPVWINQRVWAFYSPIYYGSILLAVLSSWFAAGSSLSIRVSSWLLHSIPILLVDEGIYYGQKLIRWTQFSHYQVNAEKTKISFYPKKCPQYMLIFIDLPTQNEFSQASELVAARVLKRLPDSPMPWNKSKMAFGISILLTIIPFMLVGLIIFPITAIWVWIFFGLASLLAFILNVLIVKNFT